MKIIKKIQSEETYSVRQPVLREGKKRETCIFDGDDLATTTHFGLFDDKKIIGVLSIYKNNNSNFKMSNQFQIRGMAILKEFQKKGFGKQLINHCENFIFANSKIIFWMNARESAVNFYEKLDYIKINSSFEIKDIGTHYVMYKEIG